MRRPVLIALLAGSALLAAALPAGATAAPLRAGVGKADITPQLGYYLGGWTRADRVVARPAHPPPLAGRWCSRRATARSRLSQVDLFMVPGGLLKHAAELNADRGFSERNVLASASHTHSGPGGYANFKTFNTAAPSLADGHRPALASTGCFDPKPADRAALHVPGAPDREGDPPGRQRPRARPAGWGSAEIKGLTDNRSIEAHLADHGIMREYGQGGARLDPGGYVHTIDPEVNVLRVDKVVRRKGKRRRVADRRLVHVRQPRHRHEVELPVLQRGPPRVGAAGVRGQGAQGGPRCRSGQEVLNVYGNSNEGDQSAGLRPRRPGRLRLRRPRRGGSDARARGARRGAHAGSPALDSRWTRVCFCGQATEGGNVADYAMVGLPFLTGSEEERGPLFDITHESFEGRRNPLPVPGQGHKEGIPLSADSRAEGRAADAGARGRPADREPARRGDGGDRGPASAPSVLAAAAPAGIKRVIESGLANEFIQYLTTPEEYDRQHYEGGSTLYGPLSVPFLIGQQAEMAQAARGGTARPGRVPLRPDQRRAARTASRTAPARHAAPSTPSRARRGASATR